MKTRIASLGQRTAQITALATAFTVALAGMAAPLAAQSQGDWTVGVGMGYVSPKDDNGSVGGSEISVDEDVRPILTVEYFFRDNIGVELLAAWPFDHDISLGGNKIGSTKQLPPTLSVNYHFPTQSAFKPFLGVGLNYTTFWDSNSSLGDLDLDDSWGVALHAGADYQISDAGAVRLDLRWIDIDTDASLNGAPLTGVAIDPWVVGVSYVHRF